MGRKILAGLLFFYALWQIVTSVDALSQGQGLGQWVWAALAIGGGVYLWKRSGAGKKK